MSITQRPYGVDLIGRQMTLYTMTNKIGASVSVLDFGAHLVSICVPDKNGRMADVCLGFDSFEEYDQKSGSLGATVGRYANRIGQACFSLNGVQYSLFANNGRNTLHGGREGFDKKWWRGQTLEAEKEDAVIFTYVAHDMEEGFPGKMHVQVTYAFDNDCRLSIRYMAQSDKDTVVNLTNHAYFNLAGQGTMLNHTLQVNADAVTDVDSELIPTGDMLDVAGTPLDLRQGAVIGERIARKGEHRLLEGANGFDCNFVLNGEGVKEAAVLTDPESGRVMTTYTTEPGIQVYTGQGLHVSGKGGAQYVPYSGVALETQHFPDSPNHPAFPTTVLKAGDTFQSATVYVFSAK
ncbi:MAG: galactose mutarotase [Clostridia bacterium]|nr:galactose mutarotase [Clostridia bacterium]